MNQKKMNYMSTLGLTTKVHSILFNVLFEFSFICDYGDGINLCMLSKLFTTGPHSQYFPAVFTDCT